MRIFITKAIAETFGLASHDTLPKSLISEGMSQYLWLTYNRLFEDITARVKLESSLTKEIKEAQ